MMIRKPTPAPVVPPELPPPAASTMSLDHLARLAAVVRDLPPAHLEAGLTCGQRIADGMPAAYAEALMWRELAAAGEVSDVS